MWRDFFPTLSVEQAQWQQRFFRCPVSITSADPAYTITWSPLSAVPPQAGSYAISLRDQASPLQLLLVLPSLPEGQRLQLAAQHPEPRLAQAACCQILSPLIEAVQTRAQAHFEAKIYCQAQTWPQPQGLPLPCHLRGHDGTDYGTGLSYWQHPEVLPDSFFTPVATDAALAASWLELPCRLRLECGRQYLSQAELSALEPGDAIFLADNKPGQTHVSLVIPGHSLCWRGILEQQGFHIHTKEHAMSKPQAEFIPPFATPTESADPAALETLDNIPVTLSFSLGTCEKSFADLVHLQPGYVMPLPPEFDQRQVAVLANGKKIGHGELIVVGDRLAVQIDQWQVKSGT
jgi:flagellar motor switch/type III secretory pathway protein FliN